MNHNQDDSKRRILEAAKICFANKGYDQTSIRQICEAAEANLALVSYYFGSKEKLYLTVIERLLFEANQKFLEKDLIYNPVEALQHFIYTFLHMVRNDRQFLMLLRHELSSDNPRKEHIRKIIAPYFEHLEKIIIAGKEQRMFHYESLELTMKFIISILVYPAYDSFLLDSFPSDPSVESEAAQTTAFIQASLHCEL